MRYEISDALLEPGGLAMDVIPRAESEGAVMRVAAAAQHARSCNSCGLSVVPRG